MSPITKDAIKKLSAEDRQALLKALCEVMAEDNSNPPISDALRAFVRGRLDDYERTREPGKPIEQFMDELRARRK